MPRVAKKTGTTGTTSKPKVYKKRTATVYRRYSTYRPRYYRPRVEYVANTSPAPEDNRSFGEKVGGFLGGLAQKAIKAITGFGDYNLPNYKIKKNALLEEANSPPTVVNNGHEFIIRHREYIGDIYSGVAGAANAPAPSPFTISSYPINPGMSTTFPWLGVVASQFEQYAIEGMLFEYKSMYSDAVVTQGGSLGTVIMATEYNAASDSFSSKIAMENYEFAQSAKPSLSMCHPIECDRTQTPISELYVRNGSLSQNQDIKTYDFGKFQIASQGIPCQGSALNLGELWVTYQIRLMKPKVYSYVDSGYARWTAAVTTPSGGSVFPGYSTYFSPVYDNIGLSLVDENTLRLPRKKTAMVYNIQYYISDPDGGTSQSAFIGYTTSTTPCVTVTGLGGLVDPQWGSKPANNGVFMQAVTGSVVSSGNVLSMYIFVQASDSPGQYVDVAFAPGIGVGIAVDINLVVNAVPLNY